MNHHMPWAVRAHRLAPAYSDDEASVLELLADLEPVLAVGEDRLVGPVAKVFALHAVPAERAAILPPPMGAVRPAVRGGDS